MKFAIKSAFAGVVSLSAFLTGCGGYYVPPGRGANLGELSPDAAAAQTGSPDNSINGMLAKRPMAQFPTAIAVVRIQASDYHSSSAEVFGRGAYTVITNRDIEDPVQIEKIGRLPGVIGIAQLSRLLLPKELQSDLQLREAAARLHADMLLIYTLDTKFTVDDKLLPLSVVTLGLSPNQVAHVTCTASAILVDTRNGYLYSAGEKTAKDRQLASAWTSEAAVDETRRRAEKAAFAGLVEDLERSWTGVYANYAVQPRRQQPLPLAPPPGATAIPWDEFKTVN